MLWIRAENAEKENERLNEELNELTTKIEDLTKSNYTLELSLKETESKYQELVASLKKEEGENLKKMGNDVNLSIQISELKGKLEAKTKSFNEYQEEKEKQIEDLNSKINMMKKESLNLKEIKVKYDVLQNELKKFSLEDMNNTKQRLEECEKIIKEKDDQINQLKSSDSHKILSEKIDELTKKNSDLESQVNELQEENDSVKQQLLIKECEITQLKESLPLNDENDPEKSNVQEKKEEKQDKTSDNLIEGDNKENNNNENINLEKKIAELEKEKAELNEQINELDAKIEKDKHCLEEQKDETEKMKKKLEKYKQIKKENKTFIDRIAELMEKLDEQKNENIKLVNDKSEIKNEYIATINKLQKDLAESEFKVKNMENQIKRLEIEKDKSKDNSNAEALRLKTLEIKNDMSLQSDEKLKEIEERLKMLTNKESSNLKDQLKEKEYNYQQMEEKYKKLENDFNELNKATEKVPEEIQKRDEAIEYYKNQLDQKEKIYNEELRIMSSLYHRLSFQCAKLRLVKEHQNYNTLNI